MSFMQEFRYQPKPTVNPGKQVYNEADKSIDFQVQNELKENFNESFALIVSHTLQVDVDLKDLRLIYCWGYCPKESWSIDDRTLSLEHAIASDVFLEPSQSVYKAHMAYDSDLYQEKTIFYVNSNTLSIGNCNEGDTLLQVQNGLYIALKDKSLSCIFIKFD